MKKILFRDNINKITFEGDANYIKSQIACTRAELDLDGIEYVGGRDFVGDRVVYFIYNANEGFSKLELETIVDNYLKGEFNEV